MSPVVAEEENIISASAVHTVIAASADDHIIAVSADDTIVSGIAEQYVTAGVRPDRIITITAVNSYFSADIFNLPAGHIHNIITGSGADFSDLLQAGLVTGYTGG